VVGVAVCGAGAVGGAGGPEEGDGGLGRLGYGVSASAASTAWNCLAICNARCVTSVGTKASISTT
jgi:hypothetical protein